MNEQMLDQEILNKLSKETPQTIFKPQCIRKKSNWSTVTGQHKLDNPYFEPKIFLQDMKNNSPKLNVLLKKIDNLDERDQKKYGKKFKHFIFSDIKSGGQGAKMLASALISTDWKLGYDAKLKGRKWGPLRMLPNSELEKNHSFYLLSSVSVFGKPISVKTKKEILARFNERPDNIYGKNARIIIMDSGFKEGIDLFDIKYVHIFEPSLNAADQKQVIGRGTRTCGQKGLEFHPTKGWPLEVYLYDLEIPDALQHTLLNAKTAQELLMKAMNMDIRLINFNYDIERLSILGSVDYELNQNVHNFTVDLEDGDADEQLVFGGAHRKFGEKKGDILQRHSNVFGHNEMTNYIKQNFAQYKWEDVKMENLCDESSKKGGTIAASAINYTPTQDFIRHYFSPRLPVKGMLLYHSVGTGKTCSAIAAATTNFEPEGYTILWVTRTTLKNDIWKNMFVQVCNENIRNRIASGEKIPDVQKEQMKLLSKSWQIRPISYKQFSNLVSKQNAYYHRLVKQNGEADPLRKTLLIIDEAHKLYGGGDLSSIERPDMNALHKALMTSYAVSGQDSVRLLLMTATPITVNAMEMVKLVNLCKTIEEQMPESFELFADQYLEQDGTFTNKGEAQYLDNIAGHISYLNREKDARQFSQPIIKRIMVPIVDENQLKNIKTFDKFLTKTDSEREVLKIKNEIEDTNKVIEDELSEIDKFRFQYLLKKECENQEKIPIKKCQTVVRKNIGKIVKETKEYTKKIRGKIKTLREEIKNKKGEKSQNFKMIANTIMKNPELFHKYKSSTYASLRNSCNSIVKTSADFTESVKQFPEVLKLDNEKEVLDEKIKILENQIKTEKDANKLKIKQLKDILKDKNLNELEKSVIKITIRSNQKNNKKTEKNRSIINRSKIKELKKGIKLNERFKKKTYSYLKKSFRKTAKQYQKNAKKEKKDLQKLRKTMRKNGELHEEIKDENIKQIADKYQHIIQNDLNDILATIKEKEDEKERKKAEKEHNKTQKLKKQQDKKIEQQEKKAKKEAEQQEKKAKKEAEQQEKKAEKERKKQEAKTIREQKATTRKTRKTKS
jgi:superfamily II DNA or RNA helicase